MKRLSDFKEQMSDDFHSTFAIVDKDTLCNLMGMPGDLVSVESIVRRYLPTAEVTFHKTNQLGKDEPYDIYLVRAVTRDEDRGPKAP